MSSKTEIIAPERIEKSILIIRNQRRMLDSNLALLYRVSVGRLNEAFKRNRDRFAADFMFQLTGGELDSLRSQIAISSTDWGGRRHPPHAFTEQGVAMLSSVLRSERAARVNIEIMRDFVRMRQILASNAQLARKMDALGKKYDAQFKVVFDAIPELMRPQELKKRKIGFLVRERASRYGTR